MTKPVKSSVKRSLTLLIILVIVILTSILAIIISRKKTGEINIRSSASVTNNNELDEKSLPLNSIVLKPGGQGSFSVYPVNQTIYQSSGTGLEAVREYLAGNPKIRTLNGYLTNLFPANFSDNSFITRQKDDIDDPLVTDKNRKHYYFQQTMHGISVYGATLAVHTKESGQGSTIYAIDGNLSFNNEIGSLDITGEQIEDLKQIAVNEAGKEVSDNSELKATVQEKTIINPSILGISEDFANYLSLPVNVTSSNLLFDRTYFIGSQTKNILLVIDNVHNLLKRRIVTSECIQNRRFMDTCKYDKIVDIRGEEGPESGDIESDQAFTYAGDIYNFFKDRFGRDGADNLGKEIIAYTHIESIDPFRFFTCPNAGLTREGNIVFCNNTVGKGIFMHEYAHGIMLNYTDLIFKNQQGVIHESVADIFAAVFTNKWTVADEVALFNIFGLTRFLDNPLKSNQPDKLFSSNYDCSDNDDGGIHKNSSVLSYAFYLMSEGGKFNGCSINPITKDFALMILYRAMTTYLRSVNNFSNIYHAMNAACKDIWGSDTDACRQVKAAMQATEMDQQPINQQKSPLCQNITERQPECASISDSTKLVQVKLTDFKLNLPKEWKMTVTTFVGTPLDKILYAGISYPQDMTKISWPKINTDRFISFEPAENSTDNIYLYPDYFEYAVSNGLDLYAYARGITGKGDEVCIKTYNNPKIDKSSGNTINGHSFIWPMWHLCSESEKKDYSVGNNTNEKSPDSSNISCANQCSACILDKRSDILPFYKGNGWDTSCGNRDNIIINWCSIDLEGCEEEKNSCAQACGRSVTPVTDNKSQTCSGKCSQCIIEKRQDILPFYQENGWNTVCENYNKITDDWCNIDPRGCGAVKSECYPVCTGV